MSYAIWGYVLTTGILVGYAWRLLSRGRKLARTLPAEERTWR